MAKVIYLIREIDELLEIIDEQLLQAIEWWGKDSAAAEELRFEKKDRLQMKSFLEKGDRNAC